MRLLLAVAIALLVVVLVCLLVLDTVNTIRMEVDAVQKDFKEIERQVGEFKQMLEADSRGRLVVIERLGKVSDPCLRRALDVWIRNSDQTGKLTVEGRVLVEAALKKCEEEK